MLIENPNANTLFACTQNGFAYFFARWILIRMLSGKVKRGDDETKGEANDNNNVSLFFSDPFYYSLSLSLFSMPTLMRGV